MKNLKKKKRSGKNDLKKSKFRKETYEKGLF